MSEAWEPKVEAYVGTGVLLCLRRGVFLGFAVFLPFGDLKKFFPAIRSIQEALHFSPARTDGRES